MATDETKASAETAPGGVGGGPTPSETYDRFTIPPENVVVHKWLCDAKTPARAVLILQHGFGEYVERYLTSHYEMIPKVVAAGFEVRALDFYGHGRSPGERGIVDVTKAVQHHLEVRKRAAERGLPVFLFGHSLGGMVTSGSVSASSDGVAGVVLSGPAFAAPLTGLGQSALKLVASIIPSWQVPMPRAPLEELCHDQEQVRILMEDPMKHKGKISFLVASTAVTVCNEIWDKVGTWTAPTLAIHGTADSRAQYQLCNTLIDKIASQDKELYSVDGGYHELFNALEPRETFQHVLDWLHRHLSG